MALAETVQRDMVAAMKSQDAPLLSTLRMMKAALKNRELEARHPLTDAEAQQVLATMVKQRHDSIEQFTKGNRPELAAKEAEEISVIERYMPRAATDDQVGEMIAAAIAEMTTASGQRPAAKEMGRVMKEVQSRIQAAGLRADGKKVSEMVRAALAS
jgi:uncharacterized protein YqeY